VKDKTELACDDTYLCFFDNAPKFPSIMLNNHLHKILADFRKNPDSVPADAEGHHTLKMVFVKDKISRLAVQKSEDAGQIVDNDGALPQQAISLDSSFYCAIGLDKEQNFEGCDSKDEKVNFKIVVSQEMKINLRS